jgi:regulator of protease activity HflC (stomatin/prohibitin superfamily)
MSTVLSRSQNELTAAWTWIVRWSKRHSTALILSTLIALFCGITVWKWIAIAIPAGHVGVMWYRFDGGTDTRIIYGEGTRFIWPWDRMTVYDARLQEFSRDYDVLTRDGMMMRVNIAVRSRLNTVMLGPLHKHVGPDYVDTLLAPTVGSFARIVFAKNTMDEIYTDRRSQVQNEIRQAVAGELQQDLGQPDRLEAPWLFLDDVLIRRMSFPPDVQAAVNRKMEQRQLRDEYAYRLQREKLESQRKEVEAQAIARFARIVGANFSDYLRWKGIEATLALAQSPNAKTVVVGTGKDGMPLILGGAETASPAPPPLSAPSETPAPEGDGSGPVSGLPNAGPQQQANAPAARNSESNASPGSGGDAIAAARQGSRLGD